jgi:hypothetical protein
MRHVIVRRFAMVLALFFLGAAGAFTWVVGRERPAPYQAAKPAPPAAASVFDERCGSCHTLAELSATLRAVGSVRQLEIERFLGQHAEASPEDDRVSLDYLGAGPRWASVTGGRCLPPFASLRAMSPHS